VYIAAIMNLPVDAGLFMQQSWCVRGHDKRDTPRYQCVIFYGLSSV